MELKLNVSTQGLATSDLATNQVGLHVAVASQANCAPGDLARRDGEDLVCSWR